MSHRFSQKKKPKSAYYVCLSGIPITTPLLPDGVMCGTMEISHWSVHGLCSKLSSRWRNLLLNDEFAFVPSLIFIT